MKTPKRSYYNQKRSFSKRILIIPIVVICLTVLMFFQWTRIQLAFKGYSLTEQNMILKLDDEEIKSFLIKLKRYKFRNKPHYLSKFFCFCYDILLVNNNRFL